MCHLKQIKTLILDSPKGDYTPRAWHVLQNVEHFLKNVDFPKFQNVQIEMLEYVWEHFPHIQKIRSQKILLS